MSGYINKYTHAKPTFRLSGTPEEQISQLKHEIENLHESVGKNLVREFEAISKSPGGTTIINRGGISGGGGGGGSSKKTSIHVEQTISAAGTVTVSFVDVGTNQFGTLAYLLKSNGDYSLAIPLCPPRTDSRTTNSVQVDVAEIGELHTFIILD